MRLKDRVVIITGGGSGIGRACAVLMAGEGAKIAVIDRDKTGALETVALLKNQNKAMAIIGDVGEIAFAEAAVAEVSRAWGGADILVTAAGFSCGGTVISTTPADWDEVYRANVSGTWLFARAVIPFMQRQGKGSIVTFGSQLALAGGKGNSAYIAAKGAILALTRTMALDYAADGIRVNAVAPGAVETPMLQRAFARSNIPDVMRETSKNRHALKRFGEAHEIAEAVLYLASDAASFTTGTTLVVDGGWLAA